MVDILNTILKAAIIIIAAGVFILIQLLQFSVASPGTVPELFKILPKPKLKARYRKYLVNNLNFYNRLDIKAKVRFEKKVQLYINIKQFIPRSKNLVVTDEMRALVAAAATMVTFGFPNVYLSHFRKILVYDNNYYSTITKKYHKGEVNPRGVIVLSWAALKEGYSKRSDGINLALHEFAHAIRLENRIRNDEFGFLSRNALMKFDELAEREIAAHQNGNVGNAYLREYSVTNRQEYFAVATELFFENPMCLVENSREVYDSLVAVYRIDPLKFYSAAL